MRWFLVLVLALVLVGCDDDDMFNDASITRPCKDGKTHNECVCDDGRWVCLDADDEDEDTDDEVSR